MLLNQTTIINMMKLQKKNLFICMLVEDCCMKQCNANMKNCIPSISTLNRYLDSAKDCIQEGNLDFVGLQKHLEERNLPKIVWISEDATRIKSKIEYDPKTNKILGFVLLLKNGLPNKDQFLAASVEVIQGFFKTESKASYVHLVMA